MLLSGAMAALLAFAGSSRGLLAQAVDQPLPDAPGFSSSAAVPQATPATPAGPAAPAAISGTVVDTNDDVLQGAHVTLTGPAGQRVLESGPNGQFSFPGLPPGSYKLIVTAPNMSNFESPALDLQPGETRFLSRIVLAFTTGVTEVHVTADQEQIAEEEVHTEESQRVLGVIPNFYSAYDWNTPPLNARQKYALAFRSEIDPVTFVGAAAIAGAEEYQNVYPGYGGGFSGFGKRFAAQYANDFGSRMIGSAILPSLFHQDPRYFYKGTGSTRSRALYAIRSAFITRGDNGKNEFDFSHIVGDFAAGTLANLYYPENNEGATLVLTNGLIEIGGMAGTNLLREFVLKGITTHPHLGRH
ncbi:MAG: carboxypeptidase-like regulatory domain-containing protein [Acidobacteriota bacterium]